MDIFRFLDEKLSLSFSQTVQKNTQSLAITINLKTLDTKCKCSQKFLEVFLSLVFRSDAAGKAQLGKNGAVNKSIDLQVLLKEISPTFTSH